MFESFWKKAFSAKRLGRFFVFGKPLGDEQKAPTHPAVQVRGGFGVKTNIFGPECGTEWLR